MITTIEFKYGFIYKGVRYAWKDKKLFRLPFERNLRTFGLKGIPQYVFKTTQVYNVQRDKLTSSDESFYKVGITSMDRFKSRMKTLKINYDVEILYTENADMISNFKLEQKFISEFKEYQYIPKIKFSGYTECFKVNPLEYYYHHKTNNNESNN